MALGVDQNCEVSSQSVIKSEKKQSVKSVRSDGKAMGSRRIFSVKFKLQVLDSFHKDPDCQGNQRATARKYGIHRRQVQKWLQMENNLRSTAQANCVISDASGGKSQAATLNLCAARQRVANTQPNTKEPSSSGSACGSNSGSASDSEGYINVDGFSDDEDLELDDSSSSSISSSSAFDQNDKALDFTCAALSKRKFYSIDFKIQVLNSFHNDESCQRNQRATARKYGVHHRQIQKWLNEETLLRNELLLRNNRQTESNYANYSRFTTALPTVNECLDLSSNKRSLKLEKHPEEPVCKRKPLITCFEPEFNNNVISTSLEDEALCLIKKKSQACSTPEISSSADFYCPSSTLIHPTEPNIPARSSFSVLSPSEYPTYDPNSWPFYYPHSLRIHPEKPLPRRFSPLDLKTGNVTWINEFPTYLPNLFPKLEPLTSPHFKHAEFKQINADSFKVFTASTASYSVFS